MNPEDFLAVAEEVVKGGTPAHCRTAIGRAYYSAFTIAITLLAKDVRFPKRGDKHTKVRDYLQECGIDSMRRVAQRLRDLKDKRTQADYEMDNREVEDQKTALVQIEISKKVSAGLKSALNGTDRGMIISGILAYKKMINDF